MKNLSNLIKKKQISLLNFTRYILHFNFLALLSFTSLFSDSQGLQDLGNRLSLNPLSKEDFAPISETVESAVNALKFYNFEKAYFFYTSKEFKKTTSLQDFILFIKSNPVLFHNKSISVEDITFNQSIAYYVGVGVSNDDSTRKVNMQLVLEDGRWKILGIQLK